MRKSDNFKVKLGTASNAIEKSKRITEWRLLSLGNGNIGVIVILENIPFCPWPFKVHVLLMYKMHSFIPTVLKIVPASILNSNI